MRRRLFGRKSGKLLKYNRSRDTRKGDKLKPRYTGPYVICDVGLLGRGVYRLKDGDKVLTQAAIMRPT